MKKIVKFIPRDSQVDILLDHPQPAKKYIPDWYKKMGSAWKDDYGFEHAGALKCLPLLDSFTNGYIHELPCDIEILYNGYNNNTKQDMVSYRWADYKDFQIKPMNIRSEFKGAPNNLPNFDGYYNIEFAWLTMWDPQTPKGYSTIYHHPNNRFDLPFMTFTGITDTDSWSGAGPVPFLVKRGFSGIIPAGTPIIQFSFIKRDDWRSEKENFDPSLFKKDYSVKKHLLGGYKKHHWKKKNYE